MFLLSLMCLSFYIFYIVNFVTKKEEICLDIDIYLVYIFIYFHTLLFTGILGLVCVDHMLPCFKSRLMGWEH